MIYPFPSSLAEILTCLNIGTGDLGVWTEVDTDELSLEGSDR